MNDFSKILPTSKLSSASQREKNKQRSRASVPEQKKKAMEGKLLGKYDCARRFELVSLAHRGPSRAQ